MSILIGFLGFHRCFWFFYPGQTFPNVPVTKERANSARKAHHHATRVQRIHPQMLVGTLDLVGIVVYDSLRADILRGSS